MMFWVAIGIIFNTPVSYAVAALLLFSVFDVYGHNYLVKCIEYMCDGKDSLEYKLANPAYRVIQVMFQIVLSALLYFMSGFEALALFILSWWLGQCDWLYYSILNIDYRAYNNMAWLSWTPYGIVLKLMKKPIKGYWLTLGFVTSLVILTLAAIL